MGFPIVTVASDGKFTLSKPPKTGGLVNKAVVAEQMLYEIGGWRPRVHCLFCVTIRINH